MYCLNFYDFMYEWYEQQDLLPIPPHHSKISAWLDEDLSHARKLLMAFRGAGKSTVVGLFCAWLLARDPNCRILIIGAELNLAKKMLSNTKRIIESHEACQFLIPEKKEIWSNEQIIVNRTKEWRDPSLLARGVRSNITGTRAEWIICDDVEVKTTCDTARKRENLRDLLSECEYILTPTGSQLYVGTPHTSQSIYANENTVLYEENQPFLSGYNRLVIPLINEHGKSAWERHFSMERISQLRQANGEAKFKTQMLLQFVDYSEATLNSSLLGIYNEDPQVYISNNATNYTLFSQQLMGVSCWWDPSLGLSGGDGSAVAIVFHGENGANFIHRVHYISFKKDVSNSIQHQIMEVGSLISQYRLPSIHIEQNGVGGFIPSLLREHLAKLGIACSVVAVHNTKNKQERIISNMGERLYAGKIFIHEHLQKSRFMEEIQMWNMKDKYAKDDGLDAVSGCLSLAPMPSQVSKTMSKDKNGFIAPKKTYKSTQAHNSQVIAPTNFTPL